MTTTIANLLPGDYVELSEGQLAARITAAKENLGSRLVILGHHYQRDEVIQFTDHQGDSLRLSQLAAERPQAEYIVFCGVHFMAESADILSGDHQKVMLPDLNAGCSMADMADLDQVEVCWEELHTASDSKMVPITYINSSAAIKAFVGRQEGAVCTSSNARKIFEWAFRRGQKALFLPDEHLGRNTAYRMGVPLDQMAVWDPHREQGGLDSEQIRKARVILWKGHCSVHLRFLPEHIEHTRASFPGIRVIAHPECRWEVCELADEIGSTEYIRKTVTEAPAGSQWAIGTEIHMVQRLAKENPDRTVISLDDCACLCSTMYRISPQHLCWTLENLQEDQVVNQVQVDPETKHWARVALDRMLAMR